jgi:hypothetical protein
LIGKRLLSAQLPLLISLKNRPRRVVELVVEVVDEEVLVKLVLEVVEDVDVCVEVVKDVDVDVDGSQFVKVNQGTWAGL